MHIYYVREWDSLLLSFTNLKRRYPRWNVFKYFDILLHLTYRAEIVSDSYYTVWNPAASFCCSTGSKDIEIAFCSKREYLGPEIRALSAVIHRKFRYDQLSNLTCIWSFKLRKKLSVGRFVIFLLLSTKALLGEGGIQSLASISSRYLKG